jgi:hypothetical protein
LRYVQELRRGFSRSCQGISKHRIAERASGCNRLGSSRHEFRGTFMADSLTVLFAEKSQAAAGPATETALLVARCFD